MPQGIQSNESGTTSRRKFLKFLGVSCTLPLFTKNAFSGSGRSTLQVPSIKPTSADDLVLAQGFKYEPLISWGEKISDLDSFGFNCDYTAFIPKSNNSGILWVNHEYINPLFIHGKNITSKSKKEVQNEMYNMGGSLIEIDKDKKTNRWRVKHNSSYNKRITALTKIPFANGVSIKGEKYAIGMVSNCAGGTTPWGNVLTCEENFDSYHGEREEDGRKKPGKYQWEKYYDQPPEHYGWVVEVNPNTGEAKKHTSMGRFCHECATTTFDMSGRLVVYSGDDSSNEFLYKFISDQTTSLDKGTLYVANLEQGKWLALDLDKSPKLKSKFKNQTDVLINCREAGRLLGATPLDRPEDIEVHPQTGEIYVCLSNNKKKGNYHGSILKISETNNPEEFSHQTFLAGGGDFSCPDNLTFDSKGNIWLCCDISGKKIGKSPYEKFGNNGLFFIPTIGKDAGSVFQIASAPKDAELTGVTLSPDEKTLFLSVQHPGEMSKSLDNLTSNWPENKPGSIPKPTVVQINGPLLG